MPAFGTPYWWHDGAPLPDLPTIPSAKCDLAIIGAGFTGLSAAITAKRAGANVIVIDAVVPGQGASTRNGGMFGAHTRISIAAMTRSFGADAAVALLNEAPDAYAYTRDFILSEDIDCDFQKTGRIVLASSAKRQAEQASLAAELKKLTGYELAVIPKDQLRQHIGSDAYSGALFFEDHGALQPRKFHDGLMQIALREGVEVVQNCRVLAVEGQKGAFTLRTEAGPVRCENLLHATNGYTRKPFSWLARRVFPLPSFIIATEPLPASLIDALAPGRRMMVEIRSKHSYYRVSPDGTRIIFGGRAGMILLNPKRAAKRLKATMVGIWPELIDVDISHSWMGFTGFTFEQMPHVGVHQGQHFALGYSGSGVAMAPYLGMKAAYQALGDARGETAYSLTTPTTRMYHPGGPPLFLAAGEIWYRQVMDRFEAWQARQ